MNFYKSLKGNRSRILPERRVPNLRVILGGKRRERLE